jgi:hypothetical protein
MKSITRLLLLASLFVIDSCQSNQTKEKTTKIVDSTAIHKPGDDPDPTDSIPASGYDPATADFKAADLIRKSLTTKILSSELASIPAEQRKFKYQAFDLNNDSLPEYFVAMVGPYYCGTGGCTAYLLDNKGNLINGFTVVDFPIYAASSTTDGWQDLIMKSTGKNHFIKMKNGKYPSNPSVEPVFKGDPKTKGTQVLNVFMDPYPAFTF